MHYFNNKFNFILLLAFLLATILPQAVESALAANQSSDAALEIFVGGKRYDSFKNYKETEMSEHLNAEAAPSENIIVNSMNDFGEMRGMFDKVLRTAKEPGNLKFNPTKIKTIYIKDNKKPPAQPLLKELPKDVVIKELTDDEHKQLDQIGFNTRVRQAISNFTEETDSSRNENSVSAQDLERVLRDSLSASNSPVLLISNDNRLRILTLESKNGKSSHE